MSWKCICKEVNPDDSNVCKNCGRKRPKYLAVKLDLESKEKMTTEQKALWYLMIASTYLDNANDYLNRDSELTQKVGDDNYNQAIVESKMREYKNLAENNCKNCLNILEKVETLYPDVQMKNDDGYVISIPSLKSDTYFNLGSIYFRRRIYEQAIRYYQASFDADPNQVSIYNIAMATINLPVEGGGGIFGNKKKQAAIENKREQEINLLRKTIDFAPFSKIGIESARILMEDYNITEIDI